MKMNKEKQTITELIPLLNTLLNPTLCCSIQLPTHAPKSDANPRQARSFIDE